MKTTHLDESNFDRILSSTTQPVLVDFHADWCGPCRMLGPVIDEIAEEQSGHAIIAKLNVDDAPGIAARYGITSIPALIVFKHGQPVHRTRGLQSKAELLRLLARAA